MESTNEYAVFLDVDGVINSINHLYTRGELDFDAETLPHPANGYTVWVPDYMASLVQGLYKSTDLYWLTTWRDNANQHISPILGIPKTFPSLTTAPRNVQCTGSLMHASPLRKNLQPRDRKYTGSKTLADGSTSVTRLTLPT